MPRQPRSRGYAFTINHPSPGLREDLIQYFTDRARYLVIGSEIGAGGTPHLQGFIYFRNPQEFAAVKRLFKDLHPHLESIRGSPKQNREYCIKDGDYLEMGDLPVQGKRNDLEEIRERIVEGATDLQVAESSFSQWCVYRRSFSEYRRMVSRVERDWKTVVVWCYGPTGTGKTKGAFLGCDDIMQTCRLYDSPQLAPILPGDRHQGSIELPGDNENRRLWTSQPFILPTSDFSWFDGYSGQPVVILDDYRGAGNFDYLLRLLDRYPMDVPIKGGFVNWAPRLLFITSNLSPRECFQSLSTDTLLPLYRRIDFLLFKPSIDSSFIDKTNEIRF